jgi:hypothetical protein
MNKQTFEENTDQVYKKEQIEWLRLWCEDTHSELPRIALIGDSITEQVFEGIKKALHNVAKVDFLATSYAITSTAYMKMVKAFFEDSDYAVVYYNYGLHAFNVSIEEYEKVYRALVAEFLKKSKVLLGSTTDLQTQSAEKTMEIVNERNACVERIAKELGLTVDNSYDISVEMGASGKVEDGAHFNEMGKERLAKHKAGLIKSLLKE